MKKQYATLLAAAVLALGCGSHAAAEVWSLDSCITYARANNINVIQRMAEIESGEIALDQAKNNFLPTVGAGASESLAFGRGLTADNTYANRNTSSFGVTASLSLSLSNFFGSGQAEVKAARLNLVTLLRQCEVARDNVELNVMTQYLQALYCGELLDVAKSQTALSQQQLADCEIMLEAGKIAPLDVTQAESQLAQDKLNEVTAENDLRLAMVNLATLLELSDEQRMEFQVSAVDSVAPIVPSLDEVIEIAMAHNNTILSSLDNLAAARQQITVAKTAYIPQLGFSAGLGSNYYYMGGTALDSFGSQMRHNFSQSIGFSLSIPIFDAFSRRNSVRSARNRHFSAQLSLDNELLQLKSTIIEAHTQAVNAQERLSAATVATSAALAALNAVDEKYRYGRATPTEVEQAKNTYVTAASTAVRAKYERLLRLRILAFYARR